MQFYTSSLQYACVEVAENNLFPIFLKGKMVYLAKLFIQLKWNSKSRIQYL